MMQPATPAQMPGYISCNPSAGGYLRGGAQLQDVCHRVPAARIRHKVPAAGCLPKGADRKNPPQGAGLRISAAGYLPEGRPEGSACESEVPAGGICLKQPHPTGYTVPYREATAHCREAYLPIGKLLF